jgi:hypothetical protein
VIAAGDTPRLTQDEVQRLAFCKFQRFLPFHDLPRAGAGDGVLVHHPHAGVLDLLVLLWGRDKRAVAGQKGRVCGLGWSVGRSVSRSLVANAAARRSSSTFSGACDGAALPDSWRRAPDGNDPAATARAVPYRGLTALLLLVRVLTWGRCKPKNAATSGRRNRTSETASAKRLRLIGRSGEENQRTRVQKIDLQTDLPAPF